MVRGRVRLGLPAHRSAHARDGGPVAGGQGCHHWVRHKVELELSLDLQGRVLDLVHEVYAEHFLLHKVEHVPHIQLRLPEHHVVLPPVLVVLFFGGREEQRRVGAQAGDQEALLLRLLGSGVQAVGLLVLQRVVDADHNDAGAVQQVGGQLRHVQDQQPHLRAQVPHVFAPVKISPHQRLQHNHAALLPSNPVPLSHDHESSGYF
mmetsp:Transcript_31846/g.70161  ORF Transcript_31846/g.70161 Transcript_31846/m.70161 type:complete len:205 (+) Transcript_31846:595-1209(+)